MHEHQYPSKQRSIHQYLAPLCLPTERKILITFVDAQTVYPRSGVELKNTCIKTDFTGTNILAFNSHSRCVRGFQFI
jgi:hypothetical protein